MTEIFDLTWRAYPALVLIAGGVVTAVWSAMRAVRRARGTHDPQRVLAILQGFRIAVVALAVAGLGLACWLQSPSLFGLALIIGGEELLESSVMIAALAPRG